MKDRFFTPLLSLLSLISMICFLTACGSGGSSGSVSSQAAPLNKDAVVTISVDPATFSGKADKIASSTTAIELYITQWQAGDLNALTVMNTATDTLTAANATATLSLYPTYTRICASQYSGTPAASTAPTEASCSFGILNTGNNTVTLTMLTDTWTLSALYNGVQSLALSYPGTSTPATGSVSYGVYDGNLTNFNVSNNSVPAQGINNYGSNYQVQFKDSSGNIVTGLNQTFAAATTFFNYGDNGPSIAAFAKAGAGNGTATTSIIGGIGAGVGSNGLMSETKNIILYPLNSNSPVIAYPTTTLEVQNQSGTNVTSTVLANCELQVLSGSSIQGCGITHIENNGIDSSSSDIQQGAPNNYNYMVTSTAAVAGADICYTNDAGAARDSSNNIICYDYDYFTSASGSTSCPAGGTYTNGRCQYTLNSTCTNKIQSQSGGVKSNNVYNSTAQSCTSTSVSYYMKLNSTALTLTAK